MLKVGQIERTEITGYSSEGMGVCRIEGCAVFVPNAIRGEVCDVKVTHVSRNSAHGKIEGIHVRSPHRIPRACPDAKLCGGCQLHHMDYAEELSFKAQKVTDALRRLGGQDLEAVPITGADGVRMQNAKCKMQNEATGTSAFSAESPVGSRCTSRTAAPGATSDAFGPLRQQAIGDGGCQGPGFSVQGSGDGGCGFFAPLRMTESGADSAVGGGAHDAPLPVPAAAYAYRNKAQYPVATKNGKPIAGFYKNRTHEVVPIKRCAILPEVFDRVKDVVTRWAEEDRVSVYDEGTDQGLLRHIYVRRGAVSGQVMVCVVANGDRLPRENRLVHALRREIPGLASVVLSVNRKNTNVVLGDEFRTLWGQDWIEDELCGFTFRLSPRSFYQVNHDQAQRLYEKAVELAELHGTETVLDLYCGTGTITLALSRRAGKAIGVEVVPQAIADAKENAARNGVANVEFFCADASEAAARLCADASACRDGTLPSAPPQAEYAATGSGQQALGTPAHSGAQCVPQLPRSVKATGDGGDGFFAPLRMTGRPNVIVVDPPRKGLAPDVIDAMVQMAPDRIVYVSCDPATLARDAKLLTERGYALTHAEAFDLFPRTFHVETVVLLTKK